ncbi:hypothetical protein C8F01DRAFT_1371658 [Mycena amicta]|nr:hypothetical protein C8F01DRAFT_1371658 [Mycena amicta]
MVLLIAHITVAQAATVINVVIAFLQYTLALALVALLIYFLPPVNPALAWNVIGRKLHSSLWPSLLRSDTLRGAGGRISFFSFLLLATTILVAVAGVIMPLGLSVGADIQAPVRIVPAMFVADTSPLGLATSPRGSDYMYGRICGAFSMKVCPGGAVNTTVIPQEIVDKFNSTPHGPFGMQFRRYYNGTSGRNWTTSVPVIATTESLILRNSIFAVGGLIVDLSDKPGIGLYTHTLPTNLKRGSVWSDDVMWLEPVSACVDTNLTIDYTLGRSQAEVIQVNDFNLTDRGGFYNLTHDYPILDRDGQTNLNLQHHAYKGAVLSNFYAMTNLNMSRNQSFDAGPGPTFSPARVKRWTCSTWDNVTIDLQTSCEGYGGLDKANISNVAVHCSLFLAPPQRTDGGDSRLPGDGSTWTQRMFSCAGSTRARMQHIQFTYNGTRDLTALSIKQSDINTPVLWGTENQDLNISDVDLLWGRLSDGAESDPSLSTIRSDVFYVPAGSSDIWGVSTGGLPSVMPGITWAQLSKVLQNNQIVDYSGASNFALLHKYQELKPYAGGPDIMANNLVGMQSATELEVGENVSVVAYDLRYAIPALLLFVIWIPSIFGALFVIFTGLLKLSYLKYLLTHTSAGRIALGDSALRPMNAPAMPIAPSLQRTAGSNEVEWAKGPGRTPVWMDAVREPDYGGKGQFEAVATNEHY